MKFIRQCAGWLLALELTLAALLIMGLMVPLPGRVEFKIVQSGSMTPELPVGSLVVVVPQADYRVGEIITFGQDTGKRIPTTHRIVGIEREEGRVRYLTKGDANEERDSNTAAYQDVIGRVALTIPRLGYMLDFARSRQGFTYTVMVPALLIILDELITIMGTVRGMRRRKRSVRVTPAQESETAAAHAVVDADRDHARRSYTNTTTHEHVLHEPRIRTAHARGSMDGIAVPHAL